MKPRTARTAATDEAPASQWVLTPDIRLSGEVCDDTLRSLLDQLDGLPSDCMAAAVEISTNGGDAEVARRMVLEIGLARQRFPATRFVFIGKTNVYSAGVTLMAAFPRDDRYLCRDAVLLIHCRQLDKTIELSGPMRSSLPKVRSVAAQIELGMKIEEANFRQLIEGSDVALDQLLRKAEHNWYVPAKEAHKLKLVRGLF
jgi:hypothetical protein